MSATLAKYDGLFGILSPIACVRELHRQGKAAVPYTLEIVGFGDEEGVRFPATLVSRAMAGQFDPAWLERTDASGVSMQQAIIDFGGDPDAGNRSTVAMVSTVTWWRLSSHIEQGRCC